MTDILIINGTIVDGSGEPGRPGTVAVEDGRLRLLTVDEPPPGAPSAPKRSSPNGW